MKRKEIRFNHRIDLVAAIEDCDHRIKMAMKLGEAHGREADRLRDEIAGMALPQDEKEMSQEQKMTFHGLRTKMGHHRLKADMKIRSLPRRRNDLLRLSKALGEFDTVPMAFLEDTSVKL